LPRHSQKGVVRNVKKIPHAPSPLTFWNPCPSRPPSPSTLPLILDPASTSRSPALTIKTALLSVQALLAAPEPDDPQVNSFPSLAPSLSLPLLRMQNEAQSPRQRNPPPLPPPPRMRLRESHKQSPPQCLRTLSLPASTRPA
jgi:hypothetical protein